MRGHEWTRMPAQHKSVKRKNINVLQYGGWLAAQWMRPIERVFLPCSSKLILMRIRRLPLRRRFIPETPPSGERWTPPSLGEVRQEKYLKKREREIGEKSLRELWKEREDRGGRGKEKKRHAKWKAVSEPLREGPCFLLISLVQRFLSYMAVCLTNLMVFFPLPESWMAVTPATLAIFWSQYGNGNRQP